MFDATLESPFAPRPHEPGLEVQPHGNLYRLLEELCNHQAVTAATTGIFMTHSVFAPRDEQAR